MFLLNTEAILGDGRGWKASPLNVALKERAKLRYWNRLCPSDKEIEPSIQTPLGEPQPLDSKKRGSRKKINRSAPLGNCYSDNDIRLIQPRRHLAHGRAA